MFDLLSQSALKVPLLLREENGGEFYLPQLKQRWTGSLQEALELLEKGKCYFLLYRSDLRNSTISAHLGHDWANFRENILCFKNEM